jgi:hypothetical protein
MIIYLKMAINEKMEVLLIEGSFIQVGHVLFRNRETSIARGEGGRD